MSYLSSLASKFVPHVDVRRTVVLIWPIKFYLVNSRDENYVWAWFPGLNLNEQLVTLTTLDVHGPSPYFANLYTYCALAVTNVLRESVGEMRCPSGAWFGSEVPWNQRLVIGIWD